MQIGSRLVAGEFKSGDRPDLYAGTLLLEALKARVFIAPTHKQTSSIMHIAVSRAYVPSKAQSLVLVRLPVENTWRVDVRKRALLRKNMYGHTRRSKQLGTRLARASQKSGILVRAQLDEVVSSSRTRLRGSDQNKHQSRQNGEPQSMLGKRAVVDAIHVDVLVKDLGLEHGNSVQTPAVLDATDEPEPWHQTQFSNLQIASGKMFVPQSRSGMCNIRRERAVPTHFQPTAELRTFAKLVGYLKRERQWGRRLKCGNMWEEVTTYSDSDWRCCRETRTSSSAGVILFGSHMLKTYTSNQHIIGRNSAESALYAAASGASVSQGIVSLLCDLGYVK